MGWLEFVAAYAVFFASHSLPVRPSVRSRFEARLGSSGFTLAYSALSLVVLAWLIGAAGRAPHVAVWDLAPWQVHVPLTVMGPVCLILALSIGRPNPFSFGGARNDQFDPARPGIIRLSHHPLLLVLALWAAAHVVPNGDLAHVILFGAFAAFALLGGRLIDRRKRREMGPVWQRMLDRVADAPILSASPSVGTLLRLAAGIALYGALLWAHPFLFGVSPLL
ncbi:NnrU family protein [Primorskyibacter sedentarius]|uniref:NnrU family protein n=1 Tax=Primorskyibacter sedentarius TaxID=745311 RepID=UPI003EBBB681